MLPVAVALGAVLSFARAPVHFWMNAGGGGTTDGRFGGDLIGALFGGPTAVRVVDSAPVTWEVYQTFRYGVGGAEFGYDIGVAEAGVYHCGVHLVEWVAESPGERVVEVFGGAGGREIDVYAEAGRGRGVIVEIDVDASGGSVRVGVRGKVGNPMISALTCSKVNASPGPPSPSASPVPQVRIDEFLKGGVSVEERNQPVVTLQPSEEAKVKAFSNSRQTPELLQPSPLPESSLGQDPESASELEPSMSPSATPEPSPEPSSEDSSSVIPVKRSKTGLVDTGDLELGDEDKEFVQVWDLDMDVDGNQVVNDGVIKDLKSILAEAGETRVEDWRVSAVDIEEAERDLHVSVRQSASTKLNPAKYALRMRSRFRRGEEGSNSFGGVQTSVDSGRALSLLRDDRKHEGITGLSFGSKPLLAGRAGVDADDDDDAGGNGGAGRAGVIIGAILGIIVLLALIGCVAFTIAHNKDNASSADFDAPPPPDASFIGSEVDVEGGRYSAEFSRKTQGEFIDDPDSRLTTGTDDLIDGDRMYRDSDTVDSSVLGIGTINKDVWGRGTGSDF